MRSNDRNRRWAAGVGMAAGAAFAAALIGLANAPVAGADEGSAADTAVDNFYQGIANFFAPEAAGNVLTADHFSDVFTGEGTAADQLIDTFYQQVATAFGPEGPVDALFEGHSAAATAAVSATDANAFQDLGLPASFDAANPTLSAQLDPFADALTAGATPGDADAFADLFGPGGAALDTAFPTISAALDPAYDAISASDADPFSDLFGASTFATSVDTFLNSIPLGTTTLGGFLDPFADAFLAAIGLSAM